MTRNRWYGAYSLAHVVVLVILLSACSQESVPVIEDAMEVQAVPTLTPLPPPAVEAEAPTATTIAEPTEVVQVVEVMEEVVVVEETAVISTDIPPTVTPIPPTPLPTQAPAVINVVTGQTDDGTFFIGDVNAPVRLVDYSDFV